MFFARFTWTIMIVLCLQKNYAQSHREKLAAQRKEQSEKIMEIHRILGMQQEKKYHTIAYLNTLTAEISQRKALLENLHQDLPLLKAEIAAMQTEIARLQRRLQELKKEYALWTYVAQKTTYGWGQLALIFSSESLQQFVRRIIYLQQYQEEIKREVLEIEHTKFILTEKENTLAQQLVEQEKLIQLTEEQTTALMNAQEEHEQLLANLQKNIPQIEKQLKKEQRVLASLEKEVSRWVENVQQEEKVVQPQQEEKVVQLVVTTPETAREKKKSSAKSFAELKGQLPFPVQGGIVSSHFGKQPHPVLPKVYVENLGIDIRTATRQEVYPVLEGEILMTNELPELNWMVIVNHGEYYSVYAKMENVFVKKGQKVTPQTSLGVIAKSEEGFYDLQFQIWKGQQKLDPEEWLEKNSF